MSGFQPTTAAVRALDAAHGVNSAATVVDNVTKAAIQARVTATSLLAVAAALNISASRIQRYLTGTPHKGDVMAIQLMWASVVAPVLVSIDYDLADSAGGESITITGTDLASATGVTWNGVAGTITANTATSLTFTTPVPGATGARDVVVTTAIDDSNALSLESWSPLQIAGIDGYFDSRKGVAVSGSDVTTWTEQSRSAGYTSTASFRPTKVADVFGTGVPAIRFTKGATAQWVKGTPRGLASGKTAMWIAKWTSTDTVNGDYTGNAPLTVVGDNTGNITTTCGMSAGVLRNNRYNGGWSSVDRGSGLNDGVARLVGFTHDTSGNVKAYSGTTQQGTTGTQSWNATHPDWNTIGGGYINGVNVGDGFDGDLAAVIICDGIISGGDLAKLHKWSRVGFGAAA